MTGQFETVIAGSKAFALALFAPLTERAGVRPRIAPDVAQAAALLAEAGLVIVELQSPAWLSAVQKLVAERPALRFVAALPKGAEGAAAPLRTLGVESVAWTGVAAALLPAVDRVLGRAPAPPAGPALVPPLPAGPALVPPPPSTTGAPPPASSPFAGLRDDEFDVDVAADPFAAPSGVPVAPPPTVAAPTVATPWTPSGTWPANVPDHATAEEALLAGMDRTPPPFPALGPVALQVADALSDFEVKALARAPLPVDGAPIRRAAAMRVRVGFAFATAPPRGSGFDSTAVAALLCEIDELLSEVNSLSADAPPELAPALGACRNALVKEAIDFSETAQRYSASEVDAVPAAASRKPPRAIAARVLSTEKVVDAGTGKGQKALVVLLALVLAAAGAFHGHRLYVRNTARAAGALPLPAGVPAGLSGVAVPGSGTTVLVRGAAPVDTAELERFKAGERAKGNEVTELPGGTLVIRPADPKPPGQAR